MDMLNINELKAGDVIRFEFKARGLRFTTGSEYNVLDDAEEGRYVIADDGAKCFITGLTQHHWTKVEKQPVEQPKTINLSLLTEQICIINDTYDSSFHLDLLLQFIYGYERGLNK